MKNINIFYHGNCLDGAISAALATIMVKQKYGSDINIDYHPLLHSPNFKYDESWFLYDLNIVLDFPFPGKIKNQLIWIDHHDSAFLSNSYRKIYDELKLTEPLYWNPNAPSNAGLCLKIFTNDFGVIFPEEWTKIIEWTDMIDSGKFPNPEIAVEMLDSPVVFSQLLSGHPELSKDFILDIIQTPDFEKLSKKHQWSRLLNKVRQDNWLLLEKVKEKIKIEEGVAYIELLDNTTTCYNAFMPYYLEPSIKYAVALIKKKDKIKISVGENPWANLKSYQKIDVSRLCEQYGGGGHVDVGAVSFFLEEQSKAEKIGLLIFNEIKNFLIIHSNSSLKHIP